MSEMPEVRISLEPNGTGTVRVGDVDISHAVLGISLTAAPGRGTEVLLRTRADVEVASYGRVDQATAAVLIDLGWTPPEQPHPLLIIDPRG